MAGLPPAGLQPCWLLLPAHGFPVVAQVTALCDCQTPTPSQTAQRGSASRHGSQAWLQRVPRRLVAAHSRPRNWRARTVNSRPPGELVPLPQAGVALDQPWFVSGSLLGLDLAAADLRLSQISTTTPPVRAVLLGADRAVIIKAASLFNTYARTETELDHIAQTLDRGRDQVARLKQTPSALEATAKTAGLSRWRTTQLAWILEHQRDALEGWFTLRELYWLGVEPDIAAGPTMGTWGAASLPADGCLCVSIPSPRPWEAWLGRPGSGMVSSMFADLSLWVAEGLAARRLPADLAGDVLQGRRAALHRPRTTAAPRRLGYRSPLPFYFDDVRLRRVRLVLDWGRLAAAGPRRGGHPMSVPGFLDGRARAVTVTLALALTLSSTMYTGLGLAQAGEPELQILSPDGTRALGRIIRARGTI